MANSPKPKPVVRFGAFQFDIAAGELFKDGAKLNIHGQPLAVLSALLEHRGEVVTREELHERLWAGDTFVEFEHSLNAAVMRLREALGDAAGQPRFIETVPRRGYRFMGPVRRSELGIAVLPLANLSADAEQDYFVDGMTEALITELAQIHSLRVISRTSSMHYKETTKTLPEIARELGVDGIVEGSVMRVGNRVRITAQLIHASDRHLCANSYERDLQDVLGLQRDIARAIAKEIQVTLTAKEEARLTAVRRVDPQAYDAYLVARSHLYKMTPRGLDTALEYFRLALEKDSNYAPAHAGIGYVWALRAHTGLIPPREGCANAKAAASKAIELDDSLAEGHDILGSVLVWFEWDWAAGEREYRRAIELNPNYANVRFFYSLFLFAMGRQSEAKQQIERALELDPYNSFSHHVVAVLLNDNARRPKEALVSLLKAATLQPDSLYVHLNLWSTYHQDGQYEQAHAELMESFRLSREQEAVTALERGYAEGGYARALRAAADTLARKYARGSVLPDLTVAKIYAQLGEYDRALDFLEKAYEEHCSALPYLNALWMYEPLRSHPRFRDIVRRMNFPP